MNEERDLMVVDGGNTLDLAPRMVMTTQQALARLSEFQSFVSQVMVKGVDYGQIPGVEKPTLLKPGAEKLCEIYALTPEVEVAHRIEDWENGFFHYECSCRLTNRRTGLVQAVGLGSCNSREKRYSDRWVFANEIPAGVDKNTLQKREYNGRNGKFSKYLWKNDDTYTLVNTILKMAKKRALIDAALSATRSSGIFTQDVEDWVEPEAHHPEPVKSQSRQETSTRPEPPKTEAKVQPTTTVADAEVPAFDSVGAFLKWCYDTHKLQASAVWRECATFSDIKSANDVADFKQLTVLAHSLNNLRARPAEAGNAEYTELEG